MKALGSIRDKLLNLLRSAPEGFSPVVGSILLLLITFLIVGAVISSLNLSVSGTNLQSPVANIDLESCEGGLYGPSSKQVAFKENQIFLMHKGGDSLSLDSISIRISGYGNSFQGNIPNGTGKRIEGDMEVVYLDLSSKEKNSTCYAVNNNATLKDGNWNVGERLVLCGQDSAVGTVKSSVKVSVNGNANTSDNYGFKEGTEINLKIIDNKGKNVIAERKAIVKLAD